MIKKRTATEIEEYGICNFFKSRTGEIYPYLKEDIYAFIDENDPNSFRPILEDLDYPYIEDEWNELKENFPDSNILGKYISKMKLAAYKNYGYKDSQELNDNRLLDKIEKLLKERRIEQKEKQVTCCGVIHGIIWSYNNKEKANNKLNEIIENYAYIGIIATNIRRGNREYSVQFKNGDRWEVKNANDSSRGLKCNISLVDPETPMEIFNVIIRPCTIAKPFHAIGFY